MIIVSFPQIEYSSALDLQIRVHSLRKQHSIEDCLLLLEHPPTITIGKHGNHNNVLFSKDWLESNGVKVFQIGRGGDVTYHGPGQLVGYPIWDIRNYAKGVKDFIYSIEELFIQLLQNEYTIHARHDEAYTGVWVDNQKITAIGFQINRFISMHGFAFNINTNLSHFNLINPCGILDKGVTSLQNLTHQEQSRQKIETALIRIIKNKYGVRTQLMNPEEFLAYITQKESESLSCKENQIG